MYPLHAAAVNSWQHCKTNRNALNAVQLSLCALKKRGCKNYRQITWADATESKPRRTQTRQLPAEHRDLISLSVQPGQQGTDWGISKPCEKCHWSSRSSIFFPFYFCHGCRRRAKQSPEVSIISPQTPGTGEITLYLLSHKVTVKVWWREHTVALMWCWIPRNTSDASSLPAARTKLHF